MVADEAFDDDDLHLAVFDVLLGHDAEAERIAGVGVALRDRVRQSEDFFDRHRVADLVRPERGKLLGSQRGVAFEIQLLERERERSGVLRGKLLIIQRDLLARDRLRLRRGLQILVDARRIERRRDLREKRQTCDENEGGGRDQERTTDRRENRTQHSVRMLFNILSKQKCSCGL